MGRSPCCDKIGLKKGPWTPEEDHKLLAYVEEHGHGSWRALPSKAGLQRCGKSCRLRWTNYLRPDIKRGKFSLQEEQTIIQLHALLGNRWSAIATHLPKRTDNEIKNYWNTHLKKRLAKMGIDPITHKPKNDALLSNDGLAQSKDAATLSHMAQWESARLQAEARLARQSNFCSASFQRSDFVSTAGPCLDVGWSGMTGEEEAVSGGVSLGGELESPTSTLSSAAGARESSAAFVEFAGNSSGGVMKEEEWKHLVECTGSPGVLQETAVGVPVESMQTDSEHVPTGNFVEKFTDLLLSASSDDRRFSDEGGGGSEGDYYEDDKNYWNTILNLVNASPSHSPIF